jgi:TolA-binding protein
MDQRTEACATLSELSKQFPDANQTVMEQAAVEQNRLECP